jgi:PAS domain S-box-containing protein
MSSSLAVVEGPQDDYVTSANSIDDRRELLGKNLLGLGEAVIVTDPLGKIILLNQAAESLTGWADSEAKNQPIETVFRIIHEVTRQPVVQPVKSVIEQGIIQHLAQFTLLIAKDGMERAIDDSAAPIRGPDGDLEGVVLIFKDISARRLLEKGHEESRFQGEIIIASVRDSLVVLDFDLRVCSANRAFYETFHTAAAETIGRSFFELGDGQWNIDGLRALLEGVAARDVSLDEFQVEWVFPAIGSRTILLSARRLQRKDGRGAMILLTIEDVTKRRRAEVSLAASELRFRRLFEAAKDGILILDGDSGAITDANPFLLELLGFSHPELVGKRLWEIGLLGNEEASRASFQELQEKGYVRYDDLPLKTHDGRRVEVEVVSNVYRAGGPTIIQCNIRDVTARKRLEEEQRRAKEAAEEASRAKDLFLATLSHELRTPLTPVLATVEYLEMRIDLPPELRPEIASIRRNIELEARLIDDLLDVTRIGQGKLELHRERLDVHIAVRTALEFCQAEIDAKELEISLALRAQAHFVWADSARLQQIFWNLIKNAVKFTRSEGSIRIRSTNTGRGRLAIEIADTGEGIEPETLPRIFGVFEQGNPDVTRRLGGLGLGLAIAKMLVELHGGSLTVASPGKDQGSVFRIELESIPDVKNQDPRPDPAPAAVVKEKPLKLLLVEDNSDTLRAITQLLRATGFIVGTAVNVAEAMAALSFERFHVLISDIGLPDGSGLDVMRYARDSFGLKGIAFSGYGTHEDVAACMAAGFTHHLTKPSSLKILVDLIRRTAS